MNNRFNPTPDFHEEVRAGRRVLSYSQIATFLSCRHRWYLTYYLGLHPPASPTPLVLGDIVHQAIANNLQHGTPVDTFISTHIQTLLPSLESHMVDAADELATLAIICTHRALSHIHASGWLPLEISPDVKAIELELTTALSTAPAFEHFASHIDLIAHHPATGRNWLIDYKIRGRLSPNILTMEQVNLQAMIYACMSAFHGIPLTGTGTLEVLAQLPATPKLNKDGSMSRAQIATTWPHYEQHLKQHFLNPKDYQDMRIKLSSLEFTRITTEFRPPELLNHVWQKIVLPTAELISDIILSLDSYFDPTLSPHQQFDSRIQRSLGHFQCNGCSQRDVCLAGLYDRDIHSLVSTRSSQSQVIRQALNLEAF